MFCTSSQKIYIKGGEMLEKISTNTIHNYKLRISLPWETYKIRRRWYIASQVYTSSSFYVCFIWKFLFRIWNYFHVGCLIYFCFTLLAFPLPPSTIFFISPSPSALRQLPTYLCLPSPSSRNSAWKTASVNFCRVANTSSYSTRTNYNTLPPWYRIHYDDYAENLLM